jgi:hypothetical protein
MNRRNNNVIFDSKKKSSLFAVTVPFNTTITKQEAFQELEHLCSKLMVTEEKHSNEDSHHHLFLRTNEKQKLQDVKQMICAVYQIPITRQIMQHTDDRIYRQGLIYVGTVKREKNYIIQITNRDINPLHKGVNIGDFSFSCRALHWAQISKKFKYKDSFVLENSSRLKFLKQLHNEIEMDQLDTENVNHLNRFDINNPFSHEFAPLVYSNWANECIEWLNDWIDNGRTRKDNQLYLYGDSNIGKTTFIKHLLTTAFGKNEYHRQIFGPTPNEFKYAWQSFNKDLHKIVVIDEFETSNFSTSDLKLALSGETLISNVKGASSVMLKIDIPMIIISNEPPPTRALSSKYIGLMERLHVVHADTPIY